MKTRKEIKPTGYFHRQQLFHCLAAFSFLMSVTVLRAEEQLTAIWSNHLAQLRVPPGFTVVVPPPFVVLGGGSLADQGR